MEESGKGEGRGEKRDERRRKRKGMERKGSQYPKILKRNYKDDLLVCMCMHIMPVSVTGN